jgi:hypothetical protein
MQRNILAPKSIDVNEVNNAILELLFEELHTYLSANSLAPIEEGASDAARVSMDSLYPVDFLNTLQFNGIANPFIAQSQSINRIVQWYGVDC